MTRVVFALLAVVWLNMVCQPCVMAYELDAGEAGQHECPYCPDDDAHCDEPEPARCAFFDSVDYDGRASAPPSIESQLVFIAPTPEPASGLAITRAPCVVPDHTRQPGPPPQLHLLYCVFLN